ncbi:hypothetical protein HBI70_147290 [Parastagonospora nodorum]|nr:hypothetical protein HBI10_180770 [Parastagonospora nodorum]KAH4015031.1 hypothetical protein HBI13_165900 [Parastagonospora nodorum]KAH4107177.1 hypothetical protein HBH46_058620 [Parastagonospora nodorum]KAH4124968.1 hypothetical protein HBH47_064380 [Parastagonospora nodorum]KAH4408520.1 hypothetical protein HBH92_145350 [Parastagonospora nodorum]
MADATKNSESAAATSSSSEVKDAPKAPTSPARSDKSSDSEGKPVRDKLKETRIDAQATSEPAATSNQFMEEPTNGSAKAGEHSASGSDSDRGRLRKKRSREEFEQETEPDKQPEKKQEKETERHHVRKRSRDVKDIESGLPLKPPAASVERIEENDGDEQMTSPNKDTSKAVAKTATTNSGTSPKNKRTRDQVEGAAANAQSEKDTTTNGKPITSAEDERDSKRLRDKDNAVPAANATTSTAKIPPGSGFANTSAASPFAAMSPKSQAPKSSDRPELLPQTSDDKFKASGFGSLAKSASPFGGLASPGSKSPFAATSGNSLGSFAGSTAAPAVPASGFGALGGASKSAFGGSTFGSSLGGGFGAIGGSKSALSSFATPTDLTIKGLKAKATAFGTPGHDKDADVSDEDDGEEDDTEKENNDKERQTSQPLLSQQPHETGEEGETTVWTGRAKLYIMTGEGTTKAWKERGVGNFKFNVTDEEPKKARFVLRADGTHRLLLNAAVTKQLVFGGDTSGEKPKEGRLLFNSPTSDGELELHLLKLRAESAVNLWEEVRKVQDLEL